MKLMRYGTPSWTRFAARFARAAAPDPALDAKVAEILRAVRRAGDRALLRLTERFDGVRLTAKSIHVPAREIRALAARADAGLKLSLTQMQRRIEAYHERQLERGYRIVWTDGSTIEEMVQPLAAVGLYVPGGAGAYPSSVLMNAIPARVAGVPRLVIATPPRALESNPAVAAAIVLMGLEDCVYRVGGAQAIAAMAYGTASVPRVVKIVGPGNAFVAAAKRQVRGQVEIDQEAGPSEVAILADRTAHAECVAIDLLAQAEHGSGEEGVVLITPSKTLANAVARRLSRGAPPCANPRAARRALQRQSAIVLVRNMDEGVAATNALAPEHVEVIARSAMTLARRIVCGAVFVGPFTPVAVGDYGAGPNHVLPTGGAARYSSALSVRDFARQQSLVRLTRRGLARIAADVVRVATAEGFTAHAQSVMKRGAR